jgi:hypothetical protein
VGNIEAEGRGVGIEQVMPQTTSMSGDHVASRP